MYVGSQEESCEEKGFQLHKTSPSKRIYLGTDSLFNKLSSRMSCQVKQLYFSFKQRHVLAGFAKVFALYRLILMRILK